MLPLFYHYMKICRCVNTKCIQVLNHCMLPVITTDCPLKGWLPRVLCSTEIGTPTIPVLSGSGEADRGAVPFELLDT